MDSLPLLSMDSSSPPPLPREHYVYFAKLSEQTERYSEMVSYMASLIHHHPSPELSPEERNLLSVSYKNIVGSLRSAWRIVPSVEGNEENVELVRSFRAEVEAELVAVCGDVLKLLGERLIPAATSGEAKVFYWKMKGDYYRYLAEFKEGEEKDQAAKDTLDAYSAAQEIATAELPPTHCIRLGLALNLSVFYYEIQNSSEKACAVVKQAFEEAMKELDTVGEESYKDSTLIMQVLRDNFTLWTSDMQDQSDEP